MNSGPSQEDRSGSGRTGKGRPPLRLGGMALGNGLFLHSERYWAAAIRDDDGEIKVASGTKRFPRTDDEGGVPLLRGLARLADGLLVMWPLKRRLPSSVLPIEDRRIQRAVFVSVFSALTLRGGGGSSLRREVEVMGATLLPLFAALRGSELAAYHGAEHRSIGEFEASLRHFAGSDVESGAEAVSPEAPVVASGAMAAPSTAASDAVAKEHERCGSNVIGPLLVTSLASNVAVRSLWRRPTPATALMSSLVSLGAALEVFRWMSRHPRDPFARLLAWPGHALQESVTTKEPDESQMEVARTALAELLRLEGLSLGAD